MQEAQLKRALGSPHKGIVHGSLFSSIEKESMARKDKNRKKYQTGDDAKEPPQAACVRNSSKPMKDAWDQKLSTSLKKSLQVRLALIISLLVTGHLSDMDSTKCEICDDGHYHLQRCMAIHMWRCDAYDSQYPVSLVGDHPIFESVSSTI